MMNPRILAQPAMAAAIGSVIATAAAIRWRDDGATPPAAAAPAAPAAPVHDESDPANDLTSAEMWTLMLDQHRINQRLRLDCEDHGGASCCGQGGCCGAPDIVLTPRLTMRFPRVDGELPTRSIELALVRNGTTLAMCDARASTTSVPEGGVSLAFEIGRGGEVASIASGGFAPSIVHCVEDRVRTMRFPKPAHGTVRVAVRFRFGRASSPSVW